MIMCRGPAILGAANDRLGDIHVRRSSRGQAQIISIVFKDIEISDTLHMDQLVGLMLVDGWAQLRTADAIVNERGAIQEDGNVIAIDRTALMSRIVEEFTIM